MTTVASSGSPAALPRTPAFVWWNAVFFTLLCASETGFMAGALDWGLTGIFHLPPALFIPLSAVLALGVLWTSVWAFRRALAAERSLSASS